MSDNTGKMKIKDVAKAVARSSSDNIEQIKLIQGSLGDKLTDIRKLESELVNRARAESEKAQQRELADMHAREQEQKAEQTKPAASEVKVAKAVIAKEQPKQELPETVAQEQQQTEPEKPVAQPAPREVEQPKVDIKTEAAEQQPVEPTKQQEPVQATQVEKKEEKPTDAPAAKGETKPEKPRIATTEPAQAVEKKERPKRQTIGFIRPAERIARRGGALRDDAALRNASRPAAPREDRRSERPQRPQQGNRGGYSSDRPQQGNRGGYSSDRPQQGNRGGYSSDRPQQGNRGGYSSDRPQQQRSGTGSADRPQRKPAGGVGRPRPAASAQPQQTEKGKVSNYDPNKSNYIRVFDNDKRVKSRKQQEKERRAQLMNQDDEVMRGRRPKRKQQQAARPEPVVIEKALITTDTVTVKTLSERIGKPASEIIKRLMLLGTIATINNEIDFDTAELVANEMGVKLEHRVEQTAEEIVTEDVADADEDRVKRPPVITIMGHVDHGKTSLLDKIRSSRVTAGEAGGITQHIGAYSVEAESRTITFLDTPGHEAFTAMRARGAQVTDVVVLVVAADDGIMPQTVEAINHAKASGVPIIVAINKIDLPNANVDRVKQELTEKGLVWEEWGGDTVIVSVSAHTGEGIDQLLEMILLVSDLQELKANPNRKAKGTIVEARLDKGRGPVATVLVQNGTLHVGDTVVAGTSTGRIRGMLNDLGENVKEAYPSQPVEILGLGEVPEAGDTLYATEAGSLSRAVAEERKNRIKAERVKAISKVSLDDLFSQISEGNIKDLNVIVKADVQGSVEAVTQSLEKLSNDQVRVKVIHGAVGAIANSDILLASTSNAIIIGFNVRPDATARVAAEREHIDVRLYRIIYDAIEDIEKAMKGLLDPVFEEVILGHAEVRDIFRVSAIGTIAGCYVQDGKINRNNGVRLLRDNVVIYEGKLDSLRRFKDDVKEVASGYECGMGLHNFNDIKQGDIIEAFMEQEVEQ